MRRSANPRHAVLFPASWTECGIHATRRRRTERSADAAGIAQAIRALEEDENGCGACLSALRAYGAPDHELRIEERRAQTGIALNLALALVGISEMVAHDRLGEYHYFRLGSSALWPATIVSVPRVFDLTIGQWIHERTRLAAAPR